MLKKQKRRWFVDARVQRALVVQLLKHWLLFAAATFLLLLCLQVLLGDRPRTLAAHASEVWQRCGVFYLVALLLLPAYISDVLRLSRRFAGPVQRIRAELLRMADGKAVAPVDLRKEDFWHDLAEAFNAVSAQVSQLRDGRRSAQRESSLEEVEPSCEAGQELSV